VSDEVCWDFVRSVAAVVELGLVQAEVQCAVAVGGPVASAEKLEELAFERTEELAAVYAVAAG